MVTPVSSTSFTPLRDGDVARDTRLSEIKNAKRSIASVTYCIEPDAYGFAYVDALIAAAERGVTVCLSLDALGMQGLKRLLPKADREKFDQLLSRLDALEAAGGEVVWTGTFGKQLAGIGTGSHFKCTVVDGDRAIMGGRNIADRYHGEWTDYDALVTGEIAATLGAASVETMKAARPVSALEGGDKRRDWRDTPAHLERLWALQTAEKPAVGAGPQFRFVLGNPVGSKERYQIRRELVAQIDGAKERVWLSSNYFFAQREIYDALIRAVKRGVDVRILSTGPEAVELSGLPRYNSVRQFDLLVSAGAHVFETNKHEHGKMFVFDDVAGFGSYNPELSADYRLQEGLLLSDDPRVVASVTGAFLDTESNRAAPYAGRGKRPVLGVMAAWLMRKGL